MASAALDRLLHRSTVLKIRGDSYRMKENARPMVTKEVTHEMTSHAPGVGQFQVIVDSSVRSAMIDKGLTRSSVHKYIRIIKQAFKWAAEHELAPRA